MDLGLRDRVYIVSGGSRGLGRATAESLVAEGARVVVSGRSAEALETNLAPLGTDRVATVAADNADSDTPDRLIEAAESAFGRLDGALVSVGGPPAGPVIGRTDDEWRRYFDSIFLGGLRLGSAVAERLEPGGAIGFVLSTSVKQPVPNLGMSNALRPALAMAAKTMADELGPRGIRVFGLLPGRVETERVLELDAATDDPAQTRQRHLTTIPLGRYGRPAEFGAVATFLLSPVASYVTGVMLAIDGGITRAL